MLNGPLCPAGEPKPAVKATFGLPEMPEEPISFVTHQIFTIKHEFAFNLHFRSSESPPPSSGLKAYLLVLGKKKENY